MATKTPTSRLLMDQKLNANIVAVMSDKGGVLKTSIVANVAGELARLGKKVLVIDLDPSVGLPVDFGVRAGEEDHVSSYNDAGKALWEALTAGQELTPAPGIRPGIDMIFGGSYIAPLQGSMEIFAGGTTTAEAEFARIISPICPQYDIVLIDSAPNISRSHLAGMITATARHIVIPTQRDFHSLSGLVELCTRVEAARDVNPGVHVAGIVLTNIPVQAKRELVMLRDILSQIGDRAPLLHTVIRSCMSAAPMTRNVGRTVREAIEGEEALDERRAYYRWLNGMKKKVKAGEDPGPAPLWYRPGAEMKGLMVDYENLAAEIWAVVENAQ